MSKHQELTSKFQARVNKTRWKKENLEMQMKEFETKLCTFGSSVEKTKKEWEQLDNSINTEMEKISESEAQLELKNKKIERLRAIRNDTEQLQFNKIKFLSRLQEKGARMKKQGERWLKKERALTGKLKKMEDCNFLVRQSEQQTTNRSEAALMKAQRQLKTSQIQWEEDKMHLLLEKETQNSLLKNDQEERLKVRTVTSKFKEMEQTRNVFERQSEQRKDDVNILKAALKEVQQQLKSSQIQREEQKSSLFQQTEAQINLLKQKDEWLKNKRAMTSKFREMEDTQKFFKRQSEQQKEEVNTLKAALKEAQQQLKASQIQREEEKSYLLQQTEAQINLLKKEEEWSKNERAMASNYKEMEQDWEKSVTTTIRLKSKLENSEVLLEENCG
ncbi:golgin subfamily A member 6-like protein 22 [Antennarius striatus]|uniref:golgin subfamily A member 6-like protein 22 n=1 Tax=Antennarius striatus TaxID=241820 RepID=UPI0035B4ADB5